MVRPTVVSSSANIGPRPVVICGPYASGRATLLKRLFDEFPNTFSYSVMHTTRKPHRGEQNGVHYYFISHDDMVRKIANEEFIETVVFDGDIYGTSKAAVRQLQRQGRVCVLNMRPRGVEQIKKTDLNPILIFNRPPSLEELERRWRKRGRDTDEMIKLRLMLAQYQIAYGMRPGNFHKVIHNVDKEKAYMEFKEFILKELRRQEAAGVKIRW